VEAFVMSKAVPTSSDPLSTLVDIGAVDTVYRDVYLGRAQALLAAALPAEEFRRLVREQARLAELPLAIGRAMERGDWPAVKDLSARAQAIREAVEAKQHLMDLGRDVYAVTDVKLDPFSPGLRQFVHLPVDDLSAVRRRAMEQLAALAKVDPSWRDFYGARRVAFEALPIAGGEGARASAAASTSADPRQAAVEALKRGDMSRLAKLAETLMAAAGARTAAASAPSPTDLPPVAAQSRSPAADLRFSYSADTLARAQRFGLAHRQVHSRAEVASLRHLAWDPRWPDESRRVAVKDISLPANTPEAFRERLEMLMIHPLVNSGGARHLPTLVEEDVLIEDFPDPKEGEESPATEFLSALGLSSRRGVPRTAIEQALLAHGARVIGELGLDARAFRLVCIPPDVHIRLGEAEGWGRQPLWVHFDGYLVMADGRLRALAGGHVQFGGLYDLLGVSRDYDSERLFARFAVVRRERMAAW
jgi:hypothetical protein